MDKLLDVAGAQSLRFNVFTADFAVVYRKAPNREDTCRLVSSDSDGSDEGPAGERSCCVQPSGAQPEPVGAAPSGVSFGLRSGPNSHKPEKVNI